MAVSYEKAIADVKARVNASRTSFKAGMAVLPKDRRDGMYALYAFCRAVDDIADDSPTTEISLKGLNEWRKRIAALFEGRPSEAITSALAPAIARYKLCEEDFQAIIDGMVMDATSTICVPDEKTLDLYCDRVASAVGRVSVRIFGDSTENAMAVAYHLGRAFQMTNILRDLKEDADRGRCYLPEELINKQGISSRNPQEILKNSNIQFVCKEFALQAQNQFQYADRAIKLCNPSAMKPAKVMRAYYGAIFNKLLIQDWHYPWSRVTLPQWQKFWLVLRHLMA